MLGARGSDDSFYRESKLTGKLDLAIQAICNAQREISLIGDAYKVRGDLCGYCGWHCERKAPYPLLSQTPIQGHDETDSSRNPQVLSTSTYEAVRLTTTNGGTLNSKIMFQVISYISLAISPQITIWSSLLLVSCRSSLVMEYNWLENVNIPAHLIQILKN